MVLRLGDSTTDHAADGEAPRGARTEPVDDATGVLTRRLRIALFAAVGPILVFALADLRLSTGQLGILYGLKIAAIAVLAVAIVSLRKRRRRWTVIAIALASAASLYGLSTISAILASELHTTPLLCIAVALATATLLPWGVGPQLLMASVSAGATVATIFAITGSLAALVTYPNVAVGVGLGVSVFIASEYERNRALLAQRRAEQQRAEASVRILNAELEARVAERTAALEELNRQLAHEVTVRRHAEDGLRRSEGALSALVENTDAGIWSIDRNYRITASNSVVADRYFRMYGRSFDRRVGHAEAPTAEWRALYERALAGERFSIEQEAELSGERRQYLTHFAPIVAGGTVTGVTVFSADITERKRAEETAREHQAELTHVLRLSTMGEMAAGLAHEINQPLGAIANYAQGCSHRLRAGTGEPAELARAVDLISLEALRAGEIIRRLRNLIRKEAPRREPVDLDELVGGAVRLVEPEARQHGVIVRVEGERNVPRVLADGIQIEQVALNLLRNAIEAMADAERRELRIRVAAADADTVSIAVADTGHGLPPAIAERVFDPFFTTKEGNLGMGLSISRTIVETHGGRLWAEPTPGGGTTFFLTLPVNPPQHVDDNGRPVFGFGNGDAA